MKFKFNKIPFNKNEKLIVVPPCTFNIQCPLLTCTFFSFFYIKKNHSKRVSAMNNCFIQTVAILEDPISQQISTYKNTITLLFVALCCT